MIDLPNVGSEDSKEAFEETLAGDIGSTGLGSGDAAYSWLKNFEDAPQFQVPGDNLRITSEAGPRTYRDRHGNTVTGMHTGIDYGTTPPGDTTQPFKAAADGTVDRSGYQETGAGNYTFIDHGNDYKTGYYHAAEKQEKNPGTPVTAGENIGTIGNTGDSTAPHLHFEIRKDGVPLDPKVFFNRQEVMFGK